jgi:Ca2+-binding RTX toxin-like protein
MTSDDQFSSMGIELGDRKDEARLDAKKPASFDSQATDPIPSFVAVTIDGNRGDDVLRGHKGPDTMLGGGGRDVIRIAGGGADSGDCGRGRDKAITNGADTTTHCETVVAP